MSKNLSTTKLVKAFLFTPEKPIHYKPFLSSGYICNGYIAVEISDKDVWRDLMLRLNAEAEKNHLDLLLDEKLDTTFDNAIPKQTGDAFELGITCRTRLNAETSNGYPAELFGCGSKLIAVNSIYLAPFQGYDRASASTPLAPLILQGEGYTGIVCPIHPRTIETRLRNVAKLLG